MRIGILGATGHTGRLLAARLQELGQDLVLFGRSEEKLNDLHDLGEVIVGSALDPDSLRPVFRRCTLVINCAGPYTELGWPAVQLAMEYQTDLWDLTGEQPFQLRCLELDARLRLFDTAIANAMGLEVLVSDCGADLLTQEFRAQHGEPERIDIVNKVRDFQSSKGSFESVLNILGRDTFAWREGGLVPARMGKPWRREGGRHLVWGPGVDILTVARSTGVPQVEVWFDMPALVAMGARAGSRSNKAVFASKLGPALRKLGKKAPLDPQVDTDGGPWEIQVTVQGGGHSLERTWVGKDPYGTTAEITAWCAVERLDAGNRVRRGGLLSPSQVVSPRRFFEHLNPLIRVKA